MNGRVHIGTSGWQYDHWRDAFYGDSRKADWLQFYASRFRAVEVNSTFYRLQSAQTLKRWYTSTPADFVFTIKAHRYLTHTKRLLSPLPAVIKERDNAKPLGNKLQAIVWQLPASLPCNLPRLQDFAKALHRWRRVRHVIEFRHSSWFNEDVATMLSERGISSCLSDAGDWPRWDRVTSNLVYLRLHGRPGTYASNYSQDELAQWAKKIRAWQQQGKDVFVFFDNDSEGFAVKNAISLHALVADQ